MGTHLPMRPKVTQREKKMKISLKIKSYHPNMGKCKRTLNKLFRSIGKEYI
jgi:hypothetical protein